MKDEQVCWDLKIAARYLGVSASYVRKRVRQKGIPFFRLGNKILRFRKEDLDRWLEANGCGGEVTYGQGAR
jgi:excisionase family DNA binding protein